jgi:hypothetical protein
VIVRDAAFHDLVDGVPITLTCSGEPASAAERLVELAGATPEALTRTGLALRERVERAHSLDSWAAAVAELTQEP